jgi:GDP-4-dehydro-6-deoxy-D-mannose reductase
MVLRWSERDGCDVVTARIFNIIGPGQPETLAAGAFAKQIVLAERGGGRRLRTGNLAATRDYVDVRDVARALAALAARGRTGAVYNVCSGVGVQTRYCVDVLCSLSSVCLEVEEGGKADNADAAQQVGDGSRIRDEVGWSAMIPLEKSLMDLLESWRHRGRDELAR